MKGANMFITTALALLCLVCDASAAIFSRECRQLAADQFKTPGVQLNSSDERCKQHVCGMVPETDIKFYERLSPQCSNLMDQYRSKWSHIGLSNLLTQDHICLASKFSTRPRYVPVLIANKSPIATFAMCTIPKVACTNFRKLLSALMLHPDPMPKDSFTQFYTLHLWPYPSVWHYDTSNTTCQTNTDAPGCSQSVPGDTAGLPSSVPPGRAAEPAPDRLPDSVPSFVVGRNPYVRLVSGFLDKMVHDPLRHDQWTVRGTNRRMGLDTATTWENTATSFKWFVKSLAHKGVADQDAHFAVASLQCSRSFRMDYYLRLEDMEQWFPCWMQGLGLRNFTEYGWADSSDHGRMHVGEGQQWITDSQPWRTAANALPSPGVNRIRRRRRLKPRQRNADSASATPHMHDDSSSHAAENSATQGGGNIPVNVHGMSSGSRDTGAFMTGMHLLAGGKRRRKLVTGDKCWWNPKGMSCEDYYASFTLSDGTVAPGGGSVQHLDDRGVASDETSHKGLKEEKGSRPFRPVAGGSKDEHDQNAAKKWERYYDQETADLVYQLYYEDFRMFGYEKFIVPDPFQVE